MFQPFKRMQKVVPAVQTVPAVPAVFGGCSRWGCRIQKIRRL